ncbi:MAG: methionyl-tRNA formyltransferase [Bacillota bacterium]
MVNNQRIRVLFMGTPDFSVASLETLLTDARIEVIGVVTQPDRPKGRKMVLTPPPVKAAAVAHGIPVYQPDKLRAAESVEQLVALQPDLIVTAAYGQILPLSILELPRLGCINVHASLLPEYRGGAPIHRSIIDGKLETGVTIMYMAEGLDTGDMISKVVVPITATDNTGTLHDKLSVAGATLLHETLASLISGTVQAIPQDNDLATYAPNISRSDERIDWSKSSEALYNQVRGLNPWPVAFTTWQDANFKVWEAQVGSISEYSNIDQDALPGTVVAMDASGVHVRTGNGLLILTEVQPAGKKRMAASEFVRGNTMRTGTVLGGVHV